MIIQHIKSTHHYRVTEYHRNTNPPFNIYNRAPYTAVGAWIKSRFGVEETGTTHDPRGLAVRITIQ
jgi:hypothetical protein